MNHLYMPEFILNVGGEPFVYFIHIFYVVGERMLELKALKLYLASYKDMRFDNFEEVYTKLREDLVKLAGPEYLKLQVTDRQYIMTEGEFLSSSTPKSNFAFDSYLNSRLVHNDSELPCEITAYADAIVNISQSVPVICDIYVLSNKDLKGQFIKTIMKLHDQKLITEEVPKFILNELKHLDEDLEVIVDFNIRGNIKKIRSVYQGDLSNLK